MNKLFKVYVPRDFSSVSVGSDEVAEEIVNQAKKRNLDIEVIRNGSRGAYWLEPLVEVETEKGRVGYRNISIDDVESLFESKFYFGSQNHEKYVGLVEDLDFFKNQTRITFERVGLVDPLSIKDYQSNGGFLGLKKAISMKSEEIVEEIKKSGLRGRGGAGFPTGIKWETVFKTDSDKKYIVCNADEGDSGTFSDRMIMESDPFLLIEGMVIAGLAVGADEGYIYLRSEYPLAKEVLTKAIDLAYKNRYLGKNILGSGKDFDLEVYVGAGSYVCGEETALLESLEGKRGVVRPRPPYPAINGLWNKPTLINNVNTLATVPWIIREGGDKYFNYGVGKSRGTIAIQLSGNVKHPGLVEVPFGISIKDIVYGFGGGTKTGKNVKAVLIGGPFGIYIPESMFDISIDYESLSKIGGTIGHGSIVVFDEEADLKYLARFAMEFCFIESCGKCAPCRIGSIRGLEILDKLLNQGRDERLISMFVDLSEVMINTSLCGLGGMAPKPILSLFKHFPEEFGLFKEDLEKFSF